MAWILELVWNGIRYVIENPEKGIIWAIIIISAFFVKPVYNFIAAVWDSFRLILTKPRGFLLWLVLGLIGFILLKSYGVI